MKSNILLTWLALAPIVVSAQTSRIEVIHNCADAAAATVDIYVNGTLFSNDFAFRTTTGWIDVPAGVPLDLGIAPGNSTSAAQIIATFPVSFAATNKYVVVASGIVSATGYTPSPAFNLEVFDMGQENAMMPGNTDVLVFHGSTDAPMVDVVETGVGAGTIIDDFAYTDFSGYLALPVANYVLEVQDATGTTTVRSYDAPLASLGLSGAALTVVASGFLNPSNNSAGPEFGLYVSTGAAGALIALPESKARVEVIHNCADAAAAQVDVYVNGTLAINNFAFRTTTGFMDLPAGVNLNIGIAAANSMSAADVIANFPVTFAADGKYVVVASGIVSATGYNPAPSFNLEVFASAREVAALATNTDVLVFHGSTDAPTVDVVEIGVGAGTIVDNLSYADFNGYLELPTADYILDIRDETGATTVISYAAPLATLGLTGAALTVVASGFLNPSENSNGLAFGLFASVGSQGQLVQLPVYTVGLSEAGSQLSTLVYPNPTTNVLNVEFVNPTGEASTISLVDITGRVAAQQTNSSGSGQVRTALDVDGLTSGIYSLIVQTGSATSTSKVSVVN